MAVDFVMQVLYCVALTFCDIYHNQSISPCNLLLITSISLKCL